MSDVETISFAAVLVVFLVLAYKAGWFAPELWLKLFGRGHGERS